MKNLLVAFLLFFGAIGATYACGEGNSNTSTTSNASFVPTAEATKACPITGKTCDMNSKKTAQGNAGAQFVTVSNPQGKSCPTGGCNHASIAASIAVALTLVGGIVLATKKMRI